MEKNKLRIFIDMDGVLANFEKAMLKHPDYGTKGWKPDEVLDFSTFEVISGAKEAVSEFLELGHEVFIASTAPWRNPQAWAHKRLWIEEHFPALKRKLILTHRKDFLIGDILIDDSTYRGQTEFDGTFMHFGKHFDWTMVRNTVRTITNLEIN